MSRSHEDVNDELLVIRCREGDGDALAALIARWQPRLGRFAWRLTGEREAARDVVQDAWLAIVRGIRRLDDPARFRTWAYRIVSHKCTDWVRRRAAHRNALKELHPPAAADFASARNGPAPGDEVERVRGALKSLPGDRRAILSLHYLDGMSIAEIAEVIGVPTGTVKSRLYHAREALRESLERTKS